jgi:hypothetical protein
VNDRREARHHGAQLQYSPEDLQEWIGRTQHSWQAGACQGKQHGLHDELTDNENFDQRQALPSELDEYCHCGERGQCDEQND